MRIAPGARDYVASVRENATRFYVLVRTTEKTTFSEFTVAVADLSKPPSGAKGGVEVVVEGDGCLAAELAGRIRSAGLLERLFE